MNFREYASKPFTRDDLDRLTEDEEQVLLKRRRGASVVQTALDLHMSRASVHRRENSIMQKLP